MIYNADAFATVLLLGVVEVVRICFECLLVDISEIGESNEDYCDVIKSPSDD
jgi:hypothetical protein